jgi:hypothetical protein
MMGLVLGDEMCVEGFVLMGGKSFREGNDGENDSNAAAIVIEEIGDVLTDNTQV